MEINVAQIRKNFGESYKFHFIEEIDTDHENYIINGSVEFNVTVTNTGQVLLAKGMIIGNVQLQCGRCLEDFQLMIKATFDEQYCQESDLEQIDQAGITTDDCHIYTGDIINFTDQVLETITLSIPMKPVCQDSCRGICPSCGQNLNISDCHCKNEEIDARLEILKQLLKN